MTTNESTTTPQISPRTLLKELQDNFPVFAECLPLAIGIDKQLFAQRPDVSRKMLRTAMGMHTNSLRYLKSMEKATVRFNLDGSQADEVSEEHRAHAATTLKERFKRNAEQRKQQRQAEDALRKAEEAERQRTDKLNQLAAKFSRKG